MENKTYPPFKHSMIFGVYISIVLIVLTLIFYVLNMYTEQWTGYVGYVFILAGIAYASIQYRDKRLGGFASYGQCFSSGFFAGFVAAIIVAIFTFVYMNIMGEGYVDEILLSTEENILESRPDISDDELEMAMSFTRNMMKPWWLSIIAFFSYTFFSVIFALITSIFIKKENPATAGN